MTPARFRIVKHLTAALFATAMAGLFVLGVDGLIRGVHELTRVFAVQPPATEPESTPGVVSAFIVPAEDPAPNKAE